MPNTLGVVAFPGALDDAVSLLSATNRAAGTLAGAITGTPSTFALSAGQGALFPAASFAVTIDAEILYITSRATDTLTIGARGADGTASADHSAGATVELRIIRAHHDLLRDGIVAAETKLGTGTGAPVAGKLLSSASSGASAWSDTVTGGFNLGASSGAGVGQIRASGKAKIGSNDTAVLGFAATVTSLNAGASGAITQVDANGYAWLLIKEVTSFGSMAIVACQGGATFTVVSAIAAAVNGPMLFAATSTPTTAQIGIFGSGGVVQAKNGHGSLAAGIVVYELA